jgi:hypothetical protein
MHIHESRYNEFYHQSPMKFKTYESALLYSGHKKFAGLDLIKDTNVVAGKSIETIPFRRYQFPQTRYEDMFTRINPTTGSRIISPIPEVSHTIRIGLHHNQMFECDVCHSRFQVQETGVNKVQYDVTFKVNFNTRGSVMSRIFYCIDLYANKYPGFILLLNHPIAEYFESGHLKRCLVENKLPEEFEIHKNALIAIFKKLKSSRCKIKYIEPEVDDLYFQQYLDYKVFGEFYRQLKEGNSKNFEYCYDFYYLGGNRPSYDKLYTIKCLNPEAYTNRVYGNF